MFQSWAVQFVLGDGMRAQQVLPGKATLWSRDKDQWYSVIIHIGANFPETAFVCICLNWWPSYIAVDGAVCRSFTGRYMVTLKKTCSMSSASGLWCWTCRTHRMPDGFGIVRLCFVRLRHGLLSIQKGYAASSDSSGYPPATWPAGWLVCWLFFVGPLVRLSSVRSWLGHFSKRAGILASF